MCVWVTAVSHRAFWSSEKRAKTSDGLLVPDPVEIRKKEIICVRCVKGRFNLLNKISDVKCDFYNLSQFKTVCCTEVQKKIL